MLARMCASQLVPSLQGKVETEIQVIDPNERSLLCSVLGVLQVAVQQPHGGQQHAPLKLAQNGFERSCIAGFGLSDQVRKLWLLRVGAVGHHQQRQFLHAFYRYILLARGKR